LSKAFHLLVEENGLASLTFDQPNSKANVFNRETLEELSQTIEELASRKDIKVLVLLSGKPKIFIAGADINALAGVTDPAEAEAACRAGQEIFSAWEHLPFPTIAAIRGTAMGGGLEISLASDHILVSDRSDVKLALPEVKLGILPAWGGCSRLPARIGAPDALDLILTGKNVIPKKAFKLGLADALVPDAGFERSVRSYALQVMTGRSRRSRKADLKDLMLEKNPIGRKILFDQARKQTLKTAGTAYPAPLRAIEVVRVGVEDGLEAGLAAEARALGELSTTSVSKNLIHLFHLMEGAKSDGEMDAVDPHPIDQAAVLGAGVMGGGIAQLIAAKADIPVRMKDIGTAPLATGMQHASELFHKLTKRRRMSKAEAKKRLAQLRPTLDYSGFERSDLVVEAIVEKLEIKQAVFNELAQHVAPDAILATNTSSLSIDLIGQDTPNPERVVGMHFFNPVHKMPLVEVIVGPRTGEKAIRTITTLSRKLGKTPVIVKDGPGFLVNRLLMFYSTEALWLLAEGHKIEDIDRAMTDWGMPMGPMALTDEVGIDVAVKVAHILQDAFSDRLQLPDWDEKLVQEGRLGTKTGLGFYRYNGRKRLEPDPAMYNILGVTPNVESPNLGKIAERMVLPMVNEAARCLEEGIVATPGELDLAMIMGTGFPPFRGGLCRWADQQGVGTLCEAMERLATDVGPRFTPSEALRRAEAGGGFYAVAEG